MTSERTKRCKIREELDSFKISDCEFESDVIPQHVVLSDNHSETPDNSLQFYTAAFKNNDKNFNTDSSIPNKDYLNYSPLNVNSSPQKCLTDTSVPLKHIDLCSKVKSKLAEWAVSFNVPHNTLNGLLPILKDIPGLTQMPIDAFWFGFSY